MNESPQLTGLLIGAGASYELGIPLVWDLTRELKAWLTLQKLTDLNRGWRTQGSGHSDVVINDLASVLAMPGMRYEAFSGTLRLSFAEYRQSSMNFMPSIHGLLRSFTPLGIEAGGPHHRERRRMGLWRTDTKQPMNRRRPCSLDSIPHGPLTIQERSSGYFARTTEHFANSDRRKSRTTVKPKRPSPSGRQSLPLKRQLSCLTSPPSCRTLRGSGLSKTLWGLSSVSVTVGCSRPTGQKRRCSGLRPLCGSS